MRRFYAFKIARRCRPSLSALFVLFALSAFGQRPASEKPVAGKVRVKVSEVFAAQLENASMSRVRATDGMLTTGNPAVDAVSRQYKATNIRRVFRPAGKFEGKHRKHGLHLWYEIDLDTTLSAKAAAISFGNTGPVQRVELVYKKTLQKASIIRTLDEAPEGWDAAANDTHFSKQWHYENTGQSGGKPGADIRLRDAWKIETGKPNVIVSVVDENIEYNHKDLAANMWVNAGEIAGNNIDDDRNGFVDDIHGYSFADNAGSFTGLDHGTHVAGTIGAVTNNGTGVAGVAGGSGKGDGARIMATGVAGIYGSGGYEEAYVYAADNGAVISQNSWSYGGADYYEESVRLALDYFIAEAGKDENGVQTGPMNGGIVIFSAGNENYHGKFYPAYFEDVVAVAATSDLDTRASYSNFGDWVDISAPGGDFFGNDHPERYVLSTVTGDRYSYFDGTSQACPHVSGVAALLVSKFGGPGFTPAMLRKRLLETTDNIDALNPDYAGQIGTGRLNAYKALLQNDAVAPEKISQLAVSDADVTSISLTWPSPADGSSSAYSYEMRYSTAPITAANFQEAILVSGLPIPAQAGIAETWTLTGLQPEQKYYVAIRSSDLFKNTSLLSNVAEATTQAEPALELSQTQFSLDLVTAAVATEELTLTNTGAGPLRFKMAHPAYVTPSATAGTIDAGEHLVIQLAIDAHGIAAGEYAAPLIITTNQRTTNTHTVGFTLNVTDLGQPLVEASALSLDFGDVFRNGHATMAVVLTNAGTEALTITNVVPAPARFTTDFTEEATLEPKAQLTLQVTFAPTAIATTNGTLTITTNDPEHETLVITLRGKGVVAPAIATTPASITKSLTTGATATQNIHITNGGGAPLEYAVGASFEIRSSTRVKAMVLTSDYQVREFENLLNTIPNVQAEVFQHNNIPAITLADLQSFDVVIVTNESEWMYEGSISPIRIGDLLADYIDQGGKVIVNNQVYDNDGWGLKGRFIDEQYGPFLKSSSPVGNPVELGKIEISGHPLLDGVSSLSYAGFVYDLETVPGTTVVARWSDGHIFAATKGDVVAFNMVASTSGQVAMGDAARLYENAIRWVLGQTTVKFSPAKGTIAAGNAADVEVTFDASAYATGSYSGTVDIYTNVPNKEKVRIPVTLNITGPDLGFSTSEIVEETGKGSTKVHSFTVTNNGSSPVDYTIAVENTDVVLTEPNGREAAQETARIASSAKRTFPERNSWKFTPSSPNIAQFPGRFDEASSQRQAGKTSYVTGFENLEIGSIDKQEHWNGTWGYGLFTVESKNPAAGQKHLRGTSDGLGQSLLLSPVVSISGATQKTSGSVRVNLDHAFGEEWHIYFQTGYDGLAVVAVMLKPDGKLYATTTPGLGADLFIPHDMVVNTPQGYFTLAVEVEKGTGIFSVFMDGRKVFTGQGGHDSIDNIYLFSPMQKAGPYIDVDDLQILEGGYEALSNYLAVSPLTGTLNAGQSKQLQASFNASALPFGKYSADIVITAGGVGYYTIPTTLDVTGAANFELKGIYEGFNVDYGEDSVQRFTIINTGGEPINYNLVVGAQAQGLATFSPDQGTLPVGGQQEIKVELATETLDVGEYKVPFTVQPDAGDGKAAELAFEILEPAILSLPFTEINIAEPTGSYLTGALPVTNNGKSALKFRIGLGTAPWDGALDSDEGFDPANFGPLDGTEAIVSPNQVPGTQRNYRILYEDPSYGLIQGQHGWYGTGTDWELIDDWGSDKINQLSLGNGTPSMLFSPIVNTSGSPVSSMEVMYAAYRNGNTTYQLIVQSVHEGKIVTRMQIDKSGIKALIRKASGEPEFVRLDDTKIGEYAFNGSYAVIRIDVVKATKAFKIYLDYQLIFEGQGFAGNVDQLVLYSTNEDSEYEHAAQDAVIGTAAGWLKTEPYPQSFLAGVSFPMPLYVDTQSLSGGLYEETIRFMSNDPDRRQHLVPLHLNVITPAIDVNADLVAAIAEAGRQSSDNSVTISNAGDGDLDYVFLGYGLGAASMNLPRVSTALATSGGPDGQGYSWTTSNAANGPEFEWNDISITGTKIMLRGGALKPIDIPFDFPYYGVPQSHVAITSWGYLMFGVEYLSEVISAEFEYIRNPGPPNNFISPGGQYMTPDRASGVYYRVDEEKLVVQYNDVFTDYFQDERNTYQVILYKDGTIKFVYKKMHYSYGVIGIENADASEGLQLDYLVDFGRPAENLTVLIQPAATWILPLIPEGTLTPGESIDVPISFDASALQPGEYRTTLFIGSNDPNRRATPIPVTLTVKDKVTTGVVDEENIAFRVYPVPSDNTVTVEIRKPIAQGATISMGNAQGQIMYQVEVPAGTTRHQLNLNDLNTAKGLYFLKVDAGNWNEVRKVIKK